MQSLTQQFLTFCRSKPSGEAYDFCSASGCAFSTFLREYGYAKEPECDDETWSDGPDGEQHPMPAGFDYVLNPLGGRPLWTFGALADRLEAALAKATSPQDEGSQA